MEKALAAKLQELLSGVPGLSDWTVETNPAGDKVWNVDPVRSGWVDAPEAIPLPAGALWKKERQKEEILYVGTPPTKALRSTHRVRDELNVAGDESAAASKSTPASAALRLSDEIRAWAYWT